MYCQIISLFGLKKIYLSRIKIDYWFCTEAIILSEKISSMLPSYSFPVMVSSLVFRYIERTTPKTNEYQQLYSISILNPQTLTLRENFHFYSVGLFREGEGEGINKTCCHKY